MVEHHEILAGGFVSQPAAFTDAPAEFRHVIKYWHRPVVRGGKIGMEYSTDAVLVDSRGVDPALIEDRVIEADCELIKKIVREHPGKLQNILKDLQLGTDDGVDRASATLREIGGTEADFVKAGGGVLILVVLAALALGGCTGANSNKPNKAATTPSQPKPKPNPQ